MTLKLVPQTTLVNNGYHNVMPLSITDVGAMMRRCRKTLPRRRASILCFGGMNYRLDAVIHGSIHVIHVRLEGIVMHIIGRECFDVVRDMSYVSTPRLWCCFCVWDQSDLIYYVTPLVTNKASWLKSRFLYYLLDMTFLLYNQWWTMAESNKEFKMCTCFTLKSFNTIRSAHSFLI